MFTPGGIDLAGLISTSTGAAQQSTPSHLPPPIQPAPGASTTITPVVPPCTMHDTGAFRQNLTIGADQHVCGNVNVFGGNLTVNGIVDGNVTIGSGNATISGTVNGNITALGATIYLRSPAHVSGNIEVVGGTVQRDNGATVGGSIEQGIDPQHISPPHWLGITGPYDFPWSHLIFWALAGIAIATLFPRQLALVRRAARDSLPSAFFIGLLCSVVGALLAVVLFVTCLGIPLALLLAAGLAVASVVGTVALGLWLGERLLGRSRTARRAAVLPALLGVTLLALVQTLPCVGGVMTVLMGCAGLGASILALLYARRRAVWTPDGLL
jgi:hypothetical protein